MKQKIKTWLIHWLGGVTKEESDTRVYDEYQRGREKGKQVPLPAQESFKRGIAFAYECTKDYAQSLYGKDPESWCLLMWNYINAHIQKIEDETTTIHQEQQR